ncbi:hypothetical protein [Streptomyces sp. CA-132043]|uniref:hypothetical protein n=1 Tax=Streptomyces sp. CA-132043 TaxID=3240048 RepID=UPI003D8E8701
MAMQESSRPLWMEARSERNSTESTDSTKSGTYRERVPAQTAATINLFRLLLKEKGSEEAKAFLSAAIDSSTHPDIDLLVELCTRLLHTDEDLDTKYWQHLRNFISEGEASDIERSGTAYYLARQCLDRDNLWKGLAFARRAHALNPHDYANLSIHGEALAALGKYEEAERILTESHRIEPRPDLFRYSPLCDVLIHRCNFRKLEELAKESYEKSGGSSGSEVSEYSDILMMCGKPGEALSVLKEALSQETDTWERVDLLVTASKALCQQKSFDSARELLRKDPLYEEERVLQLECANILAREGRAEEAARILAKLHDTAE